MIKYNNEHIFQTMDIAMIVIYLISLSISGQVTFNSFSFVTKSRGFSYSSVKSLNLSLKEILNNFFWYNNRLKKIQEFFLSCE